MTEPIRRRGPDQGLAALHVAPRLFRRDGGLMRRWRPFWRLKYRWRELVCAVTGHRWHFCDMSPKTLEADPVLHWNRSGAGTHRWCGRCGRYELNL
jgi:hypothetical protein